MAQMIRSHEMHMPSAVIAESHRSAATLYAIGELTTAEVLLAVAHMEQLPENVRALCIDLRGVRKVESNAMRALELALRDWRAARRGVSRVKLPDDTETDLVAIRFAHRRWDPAMTVAGAPQRKVFGARMRDQRQAVVTRSLRERAGSETT
jgi:ABC-type transporter Mla MlaB component